MAPVTHAVTHITLVSINTHRMVAFYTAAFGADLKAFNAYGTKLFRGTMAGHGFTICPNEVVKIEANRSRHQLKYQVGDLKTTLGLALATGGALLSEMTQHGDRLVAAIRDPDGNSIELEEILETE